MGSVCSKLTNWNELKPIHPADSSLSHLGRPWCGHPAPRPDAAHAPTRLPERQAIFDAMRAFVQAEYAEQTLPRPVVFKIDTLRVQGDFACLECLPLFRDGTATRSQLTTPPGGPSRFYRLKAISD